MIIKRTFRINKHLAICALAKYSQQLRLVQGPLVVFKRRVLGFVIPHTSTCVSMKYPLKSRKSWVAFAKQLEIIMVGVAASQTGQLLAKQLAKLNLCLSLLQTDVFLPRQFIFFKREEHTPTLCQGFYKCRAQPDIYNIPKVKPIIEPGTVDVLFL